MYCITMYCISQDYSADFGDSQFSSLLNVLCHKTIAAFEKFENFTVYSTMYCKCTVSQDYSADFGDSQFSSLLNVLCHKTIAAFERFENFTVYSTMYCKCTVSQDCSADFGDTQFSCAFSKASAVVLWDTVQSTLLSCNTVHSEYIVLYTVNFSNFSKASAIVVWDTVHLYNSRVVRVVQ